MIRNFLDTTGSQLTYHGISSQLFSFLCQFTASQAFSHSLQPSNQAPSSPSSGTPTSPSCTDAQLTTTPPSTTWSRTISSSTSRPSCGSGLKTSTATRPHSWTRNFASRALLAATLLDTRPRAHTLLLRWTLRIMLSSILQSESHSNFALVVSTETLTSASSQELARQLQHEEDARAQEAYVRRQQERMQRRQQGSQGHGQRGAPPLQSNASYPQGDPHGALYSEGPVQPPYNGSEPPRIRRKRSCLLM